MCSSRRPGPCGALGAGEGLLRSRAISSIPAACIGASDADQFHRRTARHAPHRGGQHHPAQMRALRLLHRHLPDLCAAGRRARQPARPHLPHQEHAGERRARHRGDGEAPRPLPLLPVLHDHLPLGRQLHAPDRRGARPCGGNLPAPAVRAPAAQRAGLHHAAARAVPPVADRREAGRAAGARSHGPSAPRASPRCWGWCRSRMPAPERFGQPGTYPAQIDAQGPRGAAHGLRAERARPRHQCRHHPAADPARLRGRGLRARRPAAARSPTTWARRRMRWPAPAAPSTSGPRPMSMP